MRVKILGRHRRASHLWNAVCSHLGLAGAVRSAGTTDVAPDRARPRILLLPDFRGWTFDNCAQALRRHLSRDFDFTVQYIEDNRPVRADTYDLVYLFFWGEQLYKQMSIDSHRLIKRVASHRWEDDPHYGPCTPRELVGRYLRDAEAVHCTSQRLADALAGQHPHVYGITSGFEPDQFYPMRRRRGPLVVGWAGNAKDNVKGLSDILELACRGRFDLRTAPGRVPFRRMNAFYNRIDVLAITSKHEGQPMPMIEAMAAGCFPVTTDVGVARELIRDGENGLIVKDRTREAFADAFAWCSKNLDVVRRAGEANAKLIRLRLPWEEVALAYKAMFLDVLARSRRPRFRNDDVSWDTPLDRFEEFCRAFRQHGFVQVHGVTLRGRTCAFAKCGADGVPYEGIPPLSRLPNAEIRRLSEPYRLEERGDLIRFLAGSADEVGLHGLYHTDYSTMTEAELRRDIAEGRALLDRLFPGKTVRYFIAPFNRTSRALYGVARDFNLDVLAGDGVHLEERILDMVIEPGAWYRYHHHRFYPESTCAFYPTTMATLRAALGRQGKLAAPGVEPQPGTAAVPTG